MGLGPPGQLRPKRKGEEGLFQRQTKTVLLSVAGVKIPEAGDVPPCRSQVSKGRGALFWPR